MTYAYTHKLGGGSLYSVCFVDCCRCENKKKNNYVAKLQKYAYNKSC